jgi:hypothetical protein
MYGPAPSHVVFLIVTFCTELVILGRLPNSNSQEFLQIRDINCRRLLTSVGAPQHNPCVRSYNIHPLEGQFRQVRVLSTGIGAPVSLSRGSQ